MKPEKKLSPIGLASVSSSNDIELPSFPPNRTGVKWMTTTVTETTERSSREWLRQFDGLLVIVLSMNAAHLTHDCPPVYRLPLVIR